MNHPSTSRNTEHSASPSLSHFPHALPYFFTLIVWFWSSGNTSHKYAHNLKHQAHCAETTEGCNYNYPTTTAETDTIAAISNQNRFAY